MSDKPLDLGSIEPKHLAKIRREFEKQKDNGMRERHVPTILFDKLLSGAEKYLACQAEVKSLRAELSEQIEARASEHRINDDMAVRNEQVTAQRNDEFAARVDAETRLVHLEAERDNLRAEVMQMRKDYEKFNDDATRAYRKQLVKVEKAEAERDEIAAVIEKLNKAFVQIRDYEPHPSACDHIHEICSQSISIIQASKAALRKGQEKL